jgi:dihydroorotate dehydrogenase electron transfer subunit
VVFLAGFRSSRQVIPVRSMGLVCPDIHLVTEDGSEGERGLVTDILAERLKASPPKASGIYSCGPVPMLRNVASLSKEFAIPCQVSMEAHMACGLGACQGCAVPGKKASAEAYLHVCKDGPVFPAETICWNSI